MQNNMEDKTGTKDNTYWAAFQASLQSPEHESSAPPPRFPLFLDSAHAVAKIRHSLDVVKNAVEHLNPGQTPVVTFDQPLFALV